jgi:outer membrane protein assembly factor BamE (lipoprotein component of BamABCDE complex)
MSNQSCKQVQTKGSQAAPRCLRGASAAALLAGGLMLAACSGAVIHQGHLFQEEDVNQIKTGMGKDQVVLALGTPDHQSSAGNNVYYYISTTANQPMPFMKPEVTDRRIVAVYFNNKERVEQVANYGMKDGKIFDFVRRETPAYSRDRGLLSELFRDIGAGPAIPGMGGAKGPGQ